RGARAAHSHRAVPGAEQPGLRRREHRGARAGSPRHARWQGHPRLHCPPRLRCPPARRRAGREAGKTVTPLLRLEDVSIGYRGRPVLEHVSFAVECGEFAALLGANGAGKTTLFRGILGLIPVLAGQIEYGFNRRTKPPGYVPQKESLDPIFPLTAYEVVLMGAA